MSTEANDQRKAPTPGSRLKGILKDLALAALVFAAFMWWQQRDLVPSGAGELPQLGLTTLDGQVISEEAILGKATQVHFWATWCGVCRREFGSLNALYEGLGDDEQIVAVVLQSGSEADVRKFVEENDIRYPVAMGTRATQEAWRIKGFPTTYYLSPDGTIATRDVGLSSRWGMKLRMWYSSLRG